MRKKIIVGSVLVIVVVLMTAFSFVSAVDSHTGNSYANTSSDVGSARVVTTNNEMLQAAQSQLEHEFFGWYSQNHGKVGEITNASGMAILQSFVKSDQLYKVQLNQIAKLEVRQQLQSSAAKPNVASTTNNTPDPTMEMEVVAIKLPWYLGGFTVGHTYYQFIQYNGMNALYYYQGIQDDLSNVNLIVSLSMGIGAGIGAGVIAGLIKSATASTLIGILIGAMGTLISWAVLTSEISTLNAAFDSTYSSGYFYTVWQETVMLDGASDSFAGYAYHISNGEGTWSTIWGPLPESVSGFSGMVQNGVNTYGSMSWFYVSQYVSPPP